MNNINEMTMDELAKYVVTRDGWEWMPGVKTTTGRISRVIDYREGLTEVVLEQYLFPYQEYDGEYTSSPSKFRPDLTDPATLGCLLAMVQKKHGAIHVWVAWRGAHPNVLGAVGRHGYYAAQHRRIVRGPYAGGTNCRPICGDDVYYQSVAHALVAALAKEAA